MTFKPDRDKLNANFDGYKLGKDSLSCITQSFDGEVRVARLKEEDFSYQHVRAFSLYNHLTVDPWDGQSVYWCTSNGSVLRGRYMVSAGLKISRVFQCPSKFGSASSSVNPSLSFITEHHCLFTSGCDSRLYILHTPSRVAASGTEDSRGGGSDDELWRLLVEVKLSVQEAECFCVLSACYSEGVLDVATLELCSSATSSEGGSGDECKSPIATYRWHRLCIDLVPLSVPLSSGQDSLVPTASVLCSLSSSAVALYSCLTYDRLVLLSEAEVEPLKTKEDGSEKDKAIKEEVTARKAVDERQESDEEGGGKFKGIGFEKESQAQPQPQYEWSQTESEVTITVALPEDVTKRDVHCVIDRREVVVGLTDGVTFFRGRLFAPISPECSTWTLEKHILEVSLEKQREGEWTSLTAEEEEEEGAGLPLRGPVAEQLSEEELAELKRRVSEATKNKGSAPDAEGHHSLLQGIQYEECDLSEGDATFFVFSLTTDIPQRVPLAGRQFIFSSPSLPQTPPVFCLKHDVDAVIWQPLAPPASSSGAGLSWNHVGTFNALAYVQAARQDKKFTVCPPSLKFAALCDCTRHVFVYLQPEDGEKGNTAAQYVTTLHSTEDILGLQATDSGLVFVLKETQLHVIMVTEETIKLLA